MLDIVAVAVCGAVVGAAIVEAVRVRRLARRLHGVALCTHELRGALTAIGLALTRLEQSPRRSGGVQLNAIRAGYDRAQSVARDLEAARGAIAGPVQRPETFDLHQITGRVVEAWNGGVPKGGEPVALDWRAGTALIDGYPMRLTQALHNLIANADEHGGGGVTVLGRRAGRYVLVSVLDRGGGLKASLDELRPRSWQARRGHGLVVARHAVELHGGTLQAVRGPRGSGVEIRLPMAGSPAVGARGERPIHGRPGPAAVGG
jgi:signal transduction histidine kinase